MEILFAFSYDKMQGKEITRRNGGQKMLCVEAAGQKATLILNQVDDSSILPDKRHTGRAT